MEVFSFLSLTYKLREEAALECCKLLQVLFKLISNGIRIQQQEEEEEGKALFNFALISSSNSYLKRF